MLSERIPSRALNWMLGPTPFLFLFSFLFFFYWRRNRSSLTHADLAFTLVWTCALNQMTRLVTKLGQALNGRATWVDTWLRPQISFCPKVNSIMNLQYGPKIHTSKAQEAIWKQFFSTCYPRKKWVVCSKRSTTSGSLFRAESQPTQYWCTNKDTESLTRFKKNIGHSLLCLNFSINILHSSLFSWV